MASWNLLLLRKPTKDECMDVAMRYVEQAAASSIPIERARHAAESAVWDLCSSRNAGSLDWPDDYREWTWPELSQHMQSTGVDAGQIVPAFHLAGLIAVRIRAWVAMTLDAHGPEPMAKERNDRDWADALQRHRSAQALDVQAFRTELEMAVQQELGNEWRQDPAARSLIERLVAQQEANKKATVQEFFNEASSFLQDKYSLAVTPCLECARQHSPKVEIMPLESALPPFHLTCTCEVNWRHEWVPPIHGYRSGYKAKRV